MQRTSDLQRFRGIHAGASIVVCGCGASLNEFSEPGRFVTIGVNDVGRRFDPTYLVVVNPRSQFKADRFRWVEDSKARALFTQLDLGRVRPPVVRFRLGTYGGTDVGAAEVLHYTQNSPYVAVCLAAYMGARRIGLIGVDLTDHHFFAETGRHTLSGRLREIDQQYGRLAATLAKDGIELVNLSPLSRLSSLRRARIGEDGGWTAADPAQASAPETAAASAASAASAGTANPRRNARVVAVRRGGPGAVGQLLDTLAATAATLGHRVVRDTHAPGAAVTVVWNGRTHHGRSPTLYCEHGWLPRADYQISPAGINADSHLAPFRWDGTPLTAQEDAALEAHLQAIKAASFSGYYQYMQAGAEAAADLPPEFLLVPLQMEGDTNLVRHAPAQLRTMQALLDYVAQVNPPWPVIFKQHPADTRHGNRHLQLRLRRRQDRIWPHAQGNVHQMLKSGACRGILTINSNVAHDGLLWDVPAIVLGRNVWPQQGERLPFPTACPRDWRALEESVAGPGARACRRAYAHYLMRGQWTLAQARDPERVAELLAGVARSARADLPRPAARTQPLLAAPRRVLPAIRPTFVRQPPERTINVVAENRGWLFEAWKERLAAAPVPGFRVAATPRPLRRADAWIFVRAREAAATPDPSRTVVQLHDLYDGGMYGARGERACVRRCAGLSLTHPAQQALLEAGGVDLARRRWVLQPVGWAHPAGPREEMEETPTVAWIGRPTLQGGADVTRLDWFVETAQSLRGRARVVMVGERVEEAAAAIRKAGVECRAHGVRELPLAHVTRWIGRFDCVVLCGAADSAPWPLFDAIHAGVPVVAPPVGWAGTLLADGACGVLAEGPAAIAAAVGRVLERRGEWRSRGAEMRARVAEYGIAAWVDANLALAAELAARSARRAA